MQLPPPGDSGAPQREGITLPAPYTTPEFSQFLDSRQLTVLDVVPGVAWGTRRLLLGDPETGEVDYAMTVSRPSAGPGPTAREERVLGEAHEKLPDALRETLPQIVTHLEVFTNLDALIVTGVRGLRSTGMRPPPPPPRVLLMAMDAWLTSVWRETAGETARFDLGQQAIELLLDRYAGTTQLEAPLDVLKSTLERVDDLEVTSTLTHGCLCLRHCFFREAVVVGVDDWGLGAAAGDPMRDVGEFTVQLAGPRLPEVIAGDSAYADLFRQFLASALNRLGLPRQIWRHTLLLAQLERAIRALQHDDHDGMVLLVRAVQSLPRRRV